ncbi:MAG: hypothetical protein Greene041662_630 [Candidatus Peregrinibacteria bacterium Greene0416_62]|nr:MAG: hypothetical protein Greene041662_630 [Candidatus Peregrinibacteria bacterium Greene0416_62]
MEIAYREFVESTIFRYGFSMPTFDFLCTACNHTFEFSRPFGNTKIPSCPSCGSKKTEKQIAPPSIQFKGSGFYKTDSQKTPAPSEQAKPKELTKPAEPTKPTPPPTPKKEDSKGK